MTEAAPERTASAGSDSGTLRARGKRWVGPLLALAVLAALWTGVHHELRDFRYQDVVGAVRNLPSGRFWLATALALAAYLVLAGYDVIALRAIGRRFPFWRVSLTSFIAYAMSQTLGFALFTGGSVRYRSWTAWGLSATEIATAVSYVVTTFTIGLIGVAGAALVVEPAGTAALLRVPLPSLRPLGIVCLLLVGAYLAWSAVRRGPIHWRGWELPVPTFRLALAQLAVAAVDWSLAALVLFVLLPPTAGLTFPIVLGAFLVAQTVGIVSHVPGGLGIVEGITVLMLSPYLDGPVVLGSMVAFRAAYYLIPFAIGLVLLLGAEGYRQRERLAVAAQRTGWVANVVAGRWIPAVLPFVLGGAAFVAGVILLFSGATPSVHGRVRLLTAWLPLGIIELSHFLSSLVGAALVVLGWALSRRLDAAYRLTQGLLLVGIVASLLKGFDWEEAAALSIVLGAMLPARRVFYRRAALMSESFSPGWIAAVVGVLGFTVWLGLFSFKHVQYSTELWWRFTVTGDGPRYLRAMVGIVGGLAVFAFARLLRHAPAEPALPTAEELGRAQTIVRAAPNGAAALALVGDKSLWFSESGQGFLMFAVSGRSWVAMGDPVGTLEEQRELAWRFREEADRHGAWSVFYEVSAECLPLYLDLGLTLLKLGEEALVPLDTFSLEGSGRKSLRRSQRDFAKHGAAFSVVPPEGVPAILDELEAVSDEWLAEKSVREKSFSLGRFDRAYLARLPVATVRIGDRLVAFANLWPANGGELSIDLMRFRTDTPNGVMQYLFTELMVWGKASGFRSFNLGMAPLSGFETHALAPLWTKAGALLYRHGEHFYNFQGLRQYKEKFDPVWRPRYLASPAGLALPRILTNVASLIAGGLSGVVSR